MNPTLSRPPARPSRPRPRSRFGYDERWWGRSAEPAPADSPSYWLATRSPLPCLVFILPFLVTYELGVSWIGGASAEALRTGVDSWMRQAMARAHLTDRWLPPLALILALLGWQSFQRGRWRFRPATLLGMAVESLVFAVALIGLGRLLEIGFDHLDGGTLLDAALPAPRPEVAALIGFLGAGVYEEAVFRLALIPLAYRAIRALLAPEVVAGTLAVTGSALLFSLAHHAGAPGEAFTLFAFVFRWLAGIFFAWVFVVRGFGIAVGTHAAYDILVGWAGWHL